MNKDDQKQVHQEQSRLTSETTHDKKQINYIMNLFLMKK